MAFVVRLPFDVVEKACPRSDFLKTQESMDALTAIISTSFNLSTWLHKLEQENCVFGYVDVTEHPFTMIGEAFELWGTSPREAGEMEITEADTLKMNLPFSDEAIEILKQEASWFGLTDEDPAAVVPAMLSLLAAMQAYDASVDGKMVKPVIRGLQVDIERLATELPLDGFAGVVDTPGSVGKEQVWGLEDEDKPADVPVLVLFESFVEDSSEDE